MFQTQRAQRDDRCCPQSYVRFLHHRGIISLFILSIIVLIPSSSSADPSTKDFYKKDYAKDSGGTLKADKLPSLKERMDALKSHTLPTPTATKQSAAEGEIKGDPLPQQGQRVLSIGGVFDATDLKKISENTDEIIELMNIFGIPPSEIYALGYREVSPSNEFEARVRRIRYMGGKFIFRHDAPPELQVTQFPSWIVELDNEKIVLDGVSSVRKYINSSGLFVDPRKLTDRRDSEVTPTPSAVEIQVDALSHEAEDEKVPADEE